MCTTKDAECIRCTSAAYVLYPPCMYVQPESPQRGMVSHFCTGPQVFAVDQQPTPQGRITCALQMVRFDIESLCFIFSNHA